MHATARFTGLAWGMFQGGQLAGRGSSFLKCRVRHANSAHGIVETPRGKPDSWAQPWWLSQDSS
jgi:hypothetical protein